jgi:hypothetical protein
MTLTVTVLENYLGPPRLTGTHCMMVAIPTDKLRQPKTR